MVVRFVAAVTVRLTASSAVGRNSFVWHSGEYPDRTVNTETAFARSRTTSGRVKASYLS